MSEVLAESLGNLPDEGLLEEARLGNRAAFQQLYVRHYEGALRYARAVVRSAADAEDVSADALLRMMVALEAGKGPVSNVPAYLRTTVRRLAIDLAARNARSVSVGLDYVPEMRREHDQELAGKEREAILEVAFTGLPQRWRKVLWMVEVLGYRPQEVAAEFEVAPAAACSLLWRARKALKRRFDELTGCVPGEL